MGTRNLTCVRIDGDFKVAQYGQWDGYPEGQGKTALLFLLSQSLDNFEEFKAAVRRCRWANDEDIAKWNAYAGIGENERWINMEQAAKFYEIAPQISRDQGAKILEIVLESKPGLPLKDSRNFAADSLFCEWCYVIDFDRSVFEVYGGFNKGDAAVMGLFANLERTKKPDGSPSDYLPVTLIKSYPLAELPSVEQFLEDLTEKDEEEEEAEAGA